MDAPTIQRIRDYAEKEEIALRSCFGDWFTNIYQRKQIKIKYKYCIVEGQFSDGNLENVLLF